MRLGRLRRVIPRREAGHIIGGSIWDILTETDHLVYSMNVNPLPDNHLRGASYSVSGNVSLLITDACEDMTESRYSHQIGKAQYGRFSYLITDTLRDKHGSVLIPVDTVGRCLEVILLLERVWEENRLENYKVFFLSS